MAQEEKAKKFMTAITKESEQRRERLSAQTEEFIAAEYKKAEDEALFESFTLIRHRAAAIREDIGRDISRQQHESKKEVIMRRDAMVEELFGRVRARLSDFTRTAEYRDFLISSAKSAVDVLGGVGTILLRQEDMAFSDELTALTGALTAPDDTIKIGGLRFLSADKRSCADDTLDTRLEGQRDWFAAHCNLKIT